ncbi:MAG: penicillin-binding protein 2 [Rickettsiales bacterium]|nr:penicillin-binding protein 2 [Rickettsiales bacterium]
MSRTTRKVIVKESTSRKIIEQSRVRLLCVSLFFTLCYGSIGYRMVEVAVLQHPHKETILVSDSDSDDKGQSIEVGASERVLQRGNIVDRNGMLLATSLITASAFANPKEISDLDDATKKLAQVLGLDAAQLAKRMGGGKSFVWIKRNLTPREQQAANSLGIPGVYFLPEEKRVYPYGNMLSHVLGYVGLDNKGLAGIEKYFDRDLRDTVNNRDNLTLSVDVRLQAIMYEEVKRAMEEFKAIGAMGVIMDLRNDEVLSMVSLPDFNPNKMGKAEDQARFNRVTLGVYEMGSTFKSFTMALGLDSGKVNMSSGYDATNPLKISTFTIQDTHPQKRWLSVPEIYTYSSNIGTAKMALDIGGAKQKAFLEKLGMMKPIDIELPERGVPQFPSEWKEINTVTISYGHGISVTPLHLVRGIAALVNGGVLPHMTLIKDGNKDKDDKERIVSEKTSQNIRRLMRLVVDHGTGSKADVAGYRLGGKTGTAEKIQGGGKYDKDAKVTSFIATFPVDHPRYVVLVMVDEPKGNKATYGYATGGWVAAPVVGNIVSRMGPLVGLRPAFDVPEDDAEKFWVDVGGKPKTQTASAKPLPKYYIHAASY